MKLFRNKIFVIVLSTVFAAALVIGGIVYFVKILPEQKKLEEWTRQVQAYRDGKLTQYRQENAAFADSPMLTEGRFFYVCEERSTH